jgi:protein tyrosine phosphatase (PTP) superfamily phosphohydrolase (DUF442 family)
MHRRTDCKGPRMLRKILTTFTGPGRAHALNGAASRRRAWWHYQMVDHGFLRYRWTNFDQVAPGVFRSNHPHESRLRAYRDQGVKAVLNLRGENDTPAYLMEREACAELGLDLISVKFAARGAPNRDKLLELFDAFDTIKRPFLMHCKSGADRAGLVSVLYLLDQGTPLAETRKHLSMKYLHLKWTKTGIQDAFLDVYAARLEQGSISIRDWVRDEYDPEAVRTLFSSRRTLSV